MRTFAMDLLTTEEVADLLRVSRATIYAWRADRTGPPAVIIGSRLRFRREDVDAWIAQHREPAERPGGGVSTP